MATERNYPFEVWEHTDRSWRCATFQLKAHAEAFARMMKQEFPRIHYQVREIPRKRRWFR